jgi:hypothetical protein
MIDQLCVLLNDFPGPANQTRCFLHILSITAKSIIKQFDIPKVKNGTEMDSAAQKLAEITEGIDSEEQDEYKNQDGEDNKPDDQPLDPWVDMNAGLSEDVRKNIERDIRPVCSMLMKVS